MARGPLPKEARRRRNQPARGDWVELGPLEDPVVPDLPADVIWRGETRLAWAAWWSDPVSAQWSPADVAYAGDTIRLHNDWLRSQMGELRQRMDALGLTPKGKKDLRWRIVDETVRREEPASTVRRLKAV